MSFNFKTFKKHLARVVSPLFIYYVVGVLVNRLNGLKLNGLKLNGLKVEGIITLKGLGLHDRPNMDFSYHRKSHSQVDCLPLRPRMAVNTERARIVVRTSDDILQIENQRFTAVATV